MIPAHWQFPRPDCVAAKLALLLFALALSPVAAFGQSPPVAGFFGGGFGRPGAFTYTQIELEEGPTLRGRIYQPYQRSDSPPIERPRRDGSRLRFEAGGLQFDLHRTATGFEGTVQPPAGGPEPAFFAIRPGSAPAQLVARYEGTYDLGGGRLLTLARNADTGSLWYLETPSGRTGFLFNLSHTEFIAGPCLYCAGPEYLRVRLLPAPGEGPANGIAVRFGGQERTVSRLATYRSEEVSFTSADGTRLAGTLFLPAGARRHPAVALVHGSGAQGRNGFFGHMRFLAEAYARRGIAALIYGKRGTGGSEGDWGRASLAVLADDAAAAVRYLAARPDVRRDRIGLSGSSQAGWIIPMAATRFPDLRIMQIRSGSAPMGVEESERRRLVRQMEADGLPPEEVALGLRIRTMMDHYARTSEGWDALAAAAEPVKDRFWMRSYIGGLPERNDGDWAWLREAFSYDVAADFARFRGRLQFLYGGSDALLDPAAPRAMLRAALRDGRAREVEIAVIPNATHNGLEGERATDRDFPGLVRFVPGYFDRIVSWAARRLR